MDLNADGAGRAVRTADPALWSGISAALAAAFTDDPVLSWLLPGTAATRTAALQRFFAVETRHIALAHRLSTTTAGSPDGAALVLPPGHWRTPLPVIARCAPDLLRVFGRRLPRALAVLATLERHHPRLPHYYLPYIGVRPEHQGAGLGTALLTPLLERCDREGLPAYLEASSPDNARLYRRLGFTTRETLRPLGSPPLELMLRTPQTPRPR